MDVTFRYLLPQNKCQEMFNLALKGDQHLWWMDERWRCCKKYWTNTKQQNCLRSMFVSSCCCGLELNAIILLHNYFISVWDVPHFFLTRKMVSTTSSKATMALTQILVIFMVRFVRLAGSGMMFGSSEAPINIMTKHNMNTAFQHNQFILQCQCNLQILL